MQNMELAESSNQRAVYTNRQFRFGVFSVSILSDGRVQIAREVHDFVYRPQRIPRIEAVHESYAWDLCIPEVDSEFSFNRFFNGSYLDAKYAPDRAAEAFNQCQAWQA